MHRRRFSLFAKKVPSCSMVNLEMFINITLRVLLSLHYLPDEEYQFTALSTI